MKSLPILRINPSADIRHPSYRTPAPKPRLPTFRGRLLGSSVKVRKGEKFGVSTAVLYLAPADRAGLSRADLNRLKSAGLLAKASAKLGICPGSTAGCRASCLADSGMGGMRNTADRRVEKTRLLASDPAAFLSMLRADLARFAAWCKRHNVIGAVRLNGTSDLTWENTGILDYALGLGLRVYDYTKIAPTGRGALPKGYAVTASLDPSKAGSIRSARAWLARGARVAVVFRTQAQIDTLISAGYAVDGDESDLRFYDAGDARIVALLEKRPAFHAAQHRGLDTSGFVYDGDPMDVVRMLGLDVATSAAA